jgi:hypothetical protein
MITGKVIILIHSLLYAWAADPRNADLYLSPRKIAMLGATVQITYPKPIPK